MERLVLEPAWGELFTDAERLLARERLDQYKYDWSKESLGSPRENNVPKRLLDRVTIKAEQCGGKPCIRGMRIRVTDVLGLLARGMKSEEILRQLPDLEPDDIQACLEYAAQLTDAPRRVSA